MKGRLLGEGTRFVLVGILNTGIDFLVFNILAYFVIGLDTSFEYFICKLLGFVAAMVNSFFFNSRFTFKQRASWLKFAAVTIASFAIGSGLSTLAFAGLITHTSLSAIMAGNISAGISTAISMCANFIGYKYFVFTHNESTA